MAGTPRERARQQTMADITRIGRDHLATHGAEGLSLRAVARDLGVVSSAIYRYVASRDELLTLLVVDAYDELGDAVDEAVRRARGPRAELRALGRAVRAWALAEPSRYALLFGTPVPGYAAPAERTTVPGTRVAVALMGIAERAWRADRLRAPSGPPLPRRLKADLDVLRREVALDVPTGVLARGLLVWPSLFGAVSWEVFGQYGAEPFADPAVLFDHHLEVLAETLGVT